MKFSGIWGNNIKNVGKSIKSILDDEFKYVFRILIASIDQLECLAKNTTKILCRECVRQKQKITVSNPLNCTSFSNYTFLSKFEKKNIYFFFCNEIVMSYFFI